MPFWNGTSRPSPSLEAGTAATASARRVVFTVTKQTSTGSSSSVTARTGTLKLPKRALRSFSPPARRCAAAAAGAMQVPSSPCLASSAPTRPPIPPGPRTATFHAGPPVAMIAPSFYRAHPQRWHFIVIQAAAQPAPCASGPRGGGKGRRSLRAITVVPGAKGSARLDDLAEPLESSGAVLVQGLALGICGTDMEITHGAYGWAPPGKDRLVLGHESLGRVVEAPEPAGLARGELVVGIVRRPDPVPCPDCAIDEWDMCRNGRYTERGIKELDGFGSELWRIEPEFAVKLDPGLDDLGVLLEPASIVAKAW